MSFGGGDNFYTKSPLFPSLSLYLSLFPFTSPGNPFVLSTFFHRWRVFNPWPGRKLPHKGDKMARLYRFFFSFPTSKTLSSAWTRWWRKKRKKKGEKIGPVCWSCASKKSRFVRPRPAYFYGRKLFFSISRPDDHFPFQDFSSGHSKSDGNGREHNGHLFSNRIGVIGVATGLRSRGSGRNLVRCSCFLEWWKI